MKTMILATLMALSISSNAAEQCSRYCNPAKSKPCGKACIPLANNCTKDWTTACAGVKPSAPKSEDIKPKHVDVAP